MSRKLSAAWSARYRRWLRYVRGSIKAMEAGRAIPLGPGKTSWVAPPPKVKTAKPLKVVVCSPHPDDECLIGALPLRLRLEAGARVTDCAITLGSNLGQRARRLRELESACRVVGFEVTVPNHPSGFDRVNADNRRNHPAEWAAKVDILREIFEREQPDVVFAPHAEDWNSTHVGTHHLAVDALGAYLKRSGRGLLPLIETEYWHQNPAPNLMVGVSPEVEAMLLMGTAEHGGEVRRNPYHLRHPGRMNDNVRLGSEVIGGQGGPAHPFPFAELYRVTFMKGKEQVAPRAGGLIVGPKEKIELEKLINPFRPEGL